MIRGSKIERGPPTGGCTSQPKAERRFVMLSRTSGRPIGSGFSPGTTQHSPRERFSSLVRWALKPLGNRAPLPSEHRCRRWRRRGCLLSPSGADRKAAAQRRLGICGRALPLGAPSHRRRLRRRGSRSGDLCARARRIASISRRYELARMALSDPPERVPRCLPANTEDPGARKSR